MILMLIQRNEENGTEKELSLETDQHLSTFIGRRGGGGGVTPGFLWSHDKIYL